MTERTLEDELTRFAEILEDNPDPWFNRPRGWARLSPSEQTEGIDRRWITLDVQSSVISSWLDNKAAGSPLQSFSVSESATVQSNSLPGSPPHSLLVTATTEGGNSSFVLTLDSQATLIRWAYALRLATQRRSLPPVPPAGREPLRATKSEYSLFPPESTKQSTKWFRYDVEYVEPGPLMLNVIGVINRDRAGKVLNNMVVVTSFDSHPDGRPGRSEQTGLICVRDYIVGVNNKEIANLEFNEAMGAIISATWPKKLHFLRDTEASSRQSSLAECWAFVYYPSLSRRRRRYIELRTDSISFRKPSPGGSASAKRDAFLSMDVISHIRPVVDKNLPADQQHVLQVACLPGSQISHVDDDDLIVGGSPVDTVELCFAKLQHMNAWRSALAVPSSGSSSESRRAITILPIETVEAVVVRAEASQGAIIGVKNSLTGCFAVREFSLSEGTLRWRRPRDRSIKAAVVPKDRSLFLANSIACALRQVFFRRSSSADPMFAFQVTLRTANGSVTMGTALEETMNMWLLAISNAVNRSPGADAVIVPLSLEASSLHNLNSPLGSVRNLKSLSVRYPSFHSPTKDSNVSVVLDSLTLNGTSASSPSPSAGADGETAAPVGEGGVEEGEAVEGLEGLEEEGLEDDNLSQLGDEGFYSNFTGPVEPGTVQGYLFRKSDRTGQSEPEFRKRWYVLRGLVLTSYKSPTEAKQKDVRGVGNIDLSTALEIREAEAANAPENSIEIVTTSSVFLFVAEDEDDQLRWLDSLNDVIEARLVAVQREGDWMDSVATEVDEEEKAERIERKKSAILMSGPLFMKSLNSVTGVTTWKERHFVIANGALSYYEHFDDYFDEDKDCLGEISVLGISLIETSFEPSCRRGCAFDLHARVIRGGDASGMRVFTFNCRTETLCVDWMTALCNANGTYRLKPHPICFPGLISTVCEEALKKRDEQRIRSSIMYANESTIQKVQASSSSNLMDSLEPQEETEEDLRRKQLALEKRSGVATRRPSLDVHAGRAGRGGVAYRRASGAGQDESAIARIMEEDEHHEDPVAASVIGASSGVAARAALFGGRGGGGRGRGGP